MKSIRKICVLLLLTFCFQTAANADWTKQNSNTLAWLRDVYFLNERTGWIVGSGGTFLVTKDGGQSWTKSATPNSNTIRQVYFTDEKNGWLLCERDVYTLGKESPSYLLKTADGGENWERVEFSGNQRKRVTKIFFNKNGLGSAIGENGVFFTMSDDVKIWKPQPSPVRYLLSDGVFNGDWNGVIVGAGGSFFFTEDSGLSWNKASVYGEQNARTNSVFFINQKTGWTVGAEGAIFQTINGGKTWREQKSNVAQDLKSVFFKNTAEGWAVGDAGIMLHTTTAGNVWTTADSVSRHNLEKVTFVGKKGFAVGFGGTILSFDESLSKNDSIAPPSN